MMKKVLRIENDGDYQKIYYTKDGVNVSNVVTELIQLEQPEIIEQPTTEEQILFETKYQTLLLETMALGGNN